MEDVVLIRFGELTLKGKNRGYFEKKLYDDVVLHLDREKIEYKLIKDRNRLYVFADPALLDKVLDVLFYVAGVKSISKAVSCEKNVEKISQKVYELIQKKGYMNKVINLEIKRSDKSFPVQSPEVANSIISYIKNMTSDVKFSYKDYQLTLYVEIQQKYAFICDHKIDCLGGLPRGSTGKGLVLLSGGMDSPVAAVFSIKRGFSIDALFFDTYNQKRYLERMFVLVERLRCFDPKMKFYINPFYKFHKYVYENISSKDLKYGCIICKRGMFYLASKLLSEKKYDALITGENISQVASQTISNMKTIYSGNTALILTPLLMLDKEEIERYAKFFKIHDVINIKHEGKCLLLADHPATHSNVKEIEKIEKELKVKEFLDILSEETKQH